MLKKYSIVEFSDGVQIIPSCWMNAEKSDSVWPSHIRNDYTLNRVIMKGEPPREDDNWDSCSIIKWYCSTDNYNRAFELRGDAMDTSNVEESDGMYEGKYNRRSSQERKRSKPLFALSSEEEGSHYEPPKRNPNKKTKTGLPVPPLRKLLQQDFTNTPTTDDYFEEMPSTVDMTHTLPASPDAIQIPTLTAASPGPAPTAAAPGPSPIAASPGPSSIVALTRPLPRAKSSSSSSSSLSLSSQFETFMRKSVAAINLRLDDMQKQLNRIERRGIMNSDNRNAVNNIDAEFSTTHNLPINNEEELRNLNNKLRDTAVFNNMVDVLKRIGGTNLAITTAMVLEKIINDSVTEKYSWCGRNKKKAFKTYKNLVKLILASVHAACSERGLLTTDVEIMNASGKWLAQTKRRITRAEIRINKDQDRTAVDEAD